MSETPGGPERRSSSGVPRWVKIFMLVFIILVSLFVILHLMGFGFGDHAMFIDSTMQHL